MKKPRLLDLFCGAGGCSMGYHRAGFDVVGVDINQQKNYPFEFHKADAMLFPLDGFDVIHASPPCQKFSVASNVHRNRGKEYPDLLTPTRKRFRKHGIPFVVENVPNSPMNCTIILCGLMFGLKVFRHRHFECSEMIMSPAHPTHGGKKIGEGYFSVAGGAGRWKSWGTVKRDVSKGTVKEWRIAMGIDWMTRKELTQAIPPAYTEWIGRQLMEKFKMV
ncbi:MAG: DNA cytosine methyltransferase [Candidatus Auribacterota bacterium]|nr:DNA cytosine methyltransferase [Candidatus Auribacterota bacterium]